MILRCNCHSEFQDKEHGPGNRVHNHNSKAGPGQPNYRCTVCENVRKREHARSVGGAPQGGKMRWKGEVEKGG